MLRAIVVEDEYRVREVLLTLLHKYCPQVQVVAEADDVESACRLIAKQQPDLVFLDIEMPGGNGFELLEHFPQRSFETIIVTSYGHYSIPAIRTQVFDYLLKPIMIPELLQAVERLEKRKKEENQLRGAGPDTLLLNNKNKLESIKVEHIVYLQADGNYTIIFSSDQRKHHLAHTLKHYEELLCKPGTDLARVHKTYIVNRCYVKYFQRGDEPSLLLHNHTRIDVSRNKKQLVSEWLAHKS